MTVLILHGIGGHPGSHWQKWLHDECVREGHTVLMPQLPESEYPKTKVWLQHVATIVENVRQEELIIVAHSLGVVTALDYLENINGKVQLLVSVSGFAEDYGSELNSYFLKEKKIDFHKVLLHLNHATILYGDDDPYVTKTALSNLANILHVTPTIIHNGGHLNEEAGYATFPLLLESINNTFSTFN